jgi:SAM-dependent methyltransferase
MLKLFMDIVCPICGEHTVMRITSGNLRETGTCEKCGSFNRQRQIASVLCQRYGVNSLQELSQRFLKIYLMESGGSFFSVLSGTKYFTCSEFYPTEKVPEGMPGYFHHADVQELPFETNSFDLIISSDVMEHVPDPYAGFAEIHRVLRPRGVHVFTVPCSLSLDEDDVFALPGPIIIKDSVYHPDPLRSTGSLVYRYFSKNTLVSKLAEIGLKTNVHILYDPAQGIIGDNAIVFESIKED